MTVVDRAPAQPFAKDKIYGHMDRVQEWLDTGQSRPVTVELDLTNICNQKCPHCFGYAPERDQARMHLDEAKRIIAQIREAGGRGLTFTGGGDPTVSPICWECVAYARSIGFDVGFITNAQTLPEDKARVLVENCQWIRVSVDAATPEVFRLTHGMDEPQFRRVLDNVRMLVRLKREARSEATIGIGFLTSPATKRDIFAFAQLGRELEVDYAQYRPLLRRHGEAEIDYSDDEILVEMRRAAQLSTNAYRVVHSEHKYDQIRSGQVQREYKKCYGQNFAAVVSADKKMYVCCHMRGVEKYCLGDLSKQSVSQIWQSSERKRIADSVDFNDCPPLCRCDSFNNILWDMKENGAPADPDPTPRKHPNFI
ncbi:MAG: radical SAM protein [Elusimicrobia bacterium]|nr:radical SAM protein [Elusimicrobiota bacterium]